MIVVEVPMFELKKLNKNAVDEALRKAERYRLLNEPGEAESICLDVLDADPDNAEAIVMLVLALSDQFEKGIENRMERALELLPRLSSDYERAYYHGVISERRAKSSMRRGTLGSGPDAYGWFVDAMQWFEKAEAVRPAHNDDAQLRWNACARKIMDNRHVRPRPEEPYEPELE